ncbi:hypothetical protein [Aquibium oceanicum]|uniref:hypothetical protein n=1 Tax=Aquibium oceanicum TaxID=1670800 RepID=UPI000B25318B|nr:hypothetical protein [Aquibium oceanicum]
MPSIPGYCAHCDLVFDGSGGIHIEGASNVVLSGNVMTCPRCHRPAKLAEGTFNVRGGNIELVSGPPLTVEILRRLQDIAERAHAKKITPDAAIREAKELDTILGNLLERFLALGLPALAAFIGLIGVYLAHASLQLQKEGVALQRESLDLQKLDSEASESFYRESLNLLKEQKAASKKVRQPPRKRVRPPHDEQGVDDKRDRPTKADAAKKTVAFKKPSKRRTEVYNQRRIELKERRRMFPRRARRAHRPQS